MMHRRQHRDVQFRRDVLSKDNVPVETAMLSAKRPTILPDVQNMTPISHALSELLPSVSSPGHLYLPQVHRQVTELAPCSPLGTALDTFVRFGLEDEHLDSKVRSSAETEMKEIVKRIELSLSRINSNVMAYRPFLVLKSLVHWQERLDKRVVCILPVKIPNISVFLQNNGSALIRLPQYTSNKDKSDIQLIFNEDRVQKRYLSCKKLYSVVLKVVRRALLSKRVIKERLHISSSRRLLEITLTQSEGWIGEIVPCVFRDGSDVMYCCQSYASAKTEEMSPLAEIGFQKYRIQISSSQSTNFRDQLKNALKQSLRETKNKTEFGTPSKVTLHHSDRKQDPYETSVHDSDECNDMDIVWYKCSFQRENCLLQAITLTDNGVRLAALAIVCKLCDFDRRLQALTPYLVQTAALHDAEYQIDHKPRWQRHSLETCTKSVLRKLYIYTSTNNAPHFLVQGINLLDGVSHRTLAIASRALHRLTTNDPALTSLISRAGQFPLNPEVSVYAGLLPSLRDVKHSSE